MLWGGSWESCTCKMVSLGHRTRNGFRGPSKNLLDCSAGLAWWLTPTSTKLYVRGSGGMEKYVERRYLPREATSTANVPRLRDGIDDRVDDSPPQALAWNRSSDWLWPVTGKSYGAPPPGAWSHLHQGNEWATIPLSRAPWVVLHMERPNKTHQQEVMEGQSNDPGVIPLTFTTLVVMWTPGNRLYPNQPALHHITVPDQRVTTSEMGDIATLFLGK